ncbi:hypothetical protein BN130_1587 [Cronobacter malonaticus 507]|nr:hypothetical protein BN130_1587 [Cronobacter malonaticus 507]
MICVSAKRYRHDEQNGRSDIYGYIVKKCDNFKEEDDKSIFIEIIIIYQPFNFKLN